MEQIIEGNRRGPGYMVEHEAIDAERNYNEMISGLSLLSTDEDVRSMVLPHGAESIQLHEQFQTISNHGDLYK